MLFTEPLEKVITNPPIRDVRARNAFYPSSASVRVMDPQTGRPKSIGGCLRRQYYEITGVNPTNHSDAAGELKKEMGGVIQELMEEKLKAAGLWMASEKSIWIPKYKISGRLDTWCWDPESMKPGKTKTPIAIEFKSTGRFGEPGLINPSKGKLMPKEDHVCQVIPYLDFFSQWPEMFHGQPMRVIIFAIGRDSLNWKEHMVFLAGKGHYGMDLKDDKRYAVVRNEAGTFQLKYITVAGVYSRYMQVAEHLRQGKVPERDYALQYDNELILKMAEKEMISKTDRGKVASAVKRDPEGREPWLKKGDWQCGWCPFKDKCWHGIDHQAKPVISQDLPQQGKSAPIPITEPKGSL